MAAVGILVQKLMDKKFDLMGQRTSRFQEQNGSVDGKLQKEKNSLVCLKK